MFVHISWHFFVFGQQWMNFSGRNAEQRQHQQWPKPCERVHNALVTGVALAKFIWTNPLFEKRYVTKQDLRIFIFNTHAFFLWLVCPFDCAGLAGWLEIDKIQYIQSVHFVYRFVLHHFIVLFVVLLGYSLCSFA